MRSIRAVAAFAVLALGAACGGSSGGGTTKHTLTITKAGAGVGTVTSSPTGINCGTTCDADFNSGGTVTLSAAATAGSAFSGWSGGCVGTAATCVVTVSADTAVTATFGVVHPTLRVFSWGGGTTDPAPGVYAHDYGDVVTLTATPSADHLFTGWSGAASGTDATVTVTLTEDVLVGARFWSGTPGTSTLPAPDAGPVTQPSGTAGNLRVLDWAGFTAAFSYTFDDARSSQSWDDNYAAMNAEGIPMTFYVIPSEVEKTPERLAFWQDVAADGHEIGNHTLNHCNVSTAGVLSNCAYGTKAADATPMQQIDDASAWIEDSLGVDGVFTMATPYGDGNWASYGEAAGFIGVRSVAAGVMMPNDLSAQFALTDSFMGTDYGGKGDTAAAMDAQIDSARAAGGWTTALVHKWLPAADPVDPGDQCCQMAVTDMVASMEYLKGLGDVWADTVVAVASYWIGQDILASATPTTSGSTTTWHWTLPPNFPPDKYVRVTVDGGTLSQGGHDLVWDTHGYYEVALDAGELTLTSSTAPSTFWALKFDGVTGVNQYVSSEHGVKLTFTIPSTDLTTGDWTVSFDYYLVAADVPQYNSAQVQFSSGAPSYTANYYNVYGVGTGAWHTLTYPLSSMTDSATGMVAGTKFSGAKSLSILFPYTTDGTAVTLYLKNISMTDGTNTPLDVVVTSSTDTSVAALGPGTGTLTVEEK